MNPKQLAGEKAATYVKDGMVLGLGTGSTAYYFVEAVGKLVKEGIRLSAVPTSLATKKQAEGLGITILDIHAVHHIDLDVDGVDEIDPAFNAIKGGGGALYREKVVASLAKEVIWIMDERKPVSAIGAFPLPVEVAKYGSAQVFAVFTDLGYAPVFREVGGEKFVTDNGNYILDLHLGKGFPVEEVKEKIERTVGVLEHGLFINFCKRMIVGKEDGSVQVIENTKKEIEKI